MTVDAFESLGLAARGPYHGGGAVDTGHDTIYIYIYICIYIYGLKRLKGR